MVFRSSLVSFSLFSSLPLLEILQSKTQFFYRPFPRPLPQSKSSRAFSWDSKNMVIKHTNNVNHINCHSKQMEGIFSSYFVSLSNKQTNIKNLSKFGQKCKSICAFSPRQCSGTAATATLSTWSPPCLLALLEWSVRIEFSLKDLNFWLNPLCISLGNCLNPLFKYFLPQCSFLYCESFSSCGRCSLR